MPPTNRPDSPLSRLLRGPLLYVLLVLAGLWLFMSFALRSPAPQKLTLSRFEQLVTHGDVKNATFFEQKQVIEGDLTNGEHYQVAFLSDRIYLPTTNESSCTWGLS